MTAASEEAAARRAWERIATDHPELEPAAAFQRRAWERLHAARPSPARPTATTAEVRDLFQVGIPLLAAARPCFEEAPPLELVRELAREAHRAFGERGAAAVERAARRRLAAVTRALEAGLRRDDAALVAEAPDLGAPPALLRTLVELTLTPTLQALASSSSHVLASAPWDRGFCPMCGAWPLFGELRDADRSRYLRCGLCAADWVFSRLRCPFCDESDHRRLHALHVDGEAEFRRAELCDGCRGYVKTLARLTPTPAALLPVDDLASAYLDLLALDAGYARPEGPPRFPARARSTAA